MGSKAYTVESIELEGYVDENGDNKIIKIHPLVIAKFRTLADVLGQLTEPKEGEEKSILDVYLEAVSFCMQTFEPPLAVQEELEQYATLPDLEYILDVVAGVRLNDPNLTAAMAAQTSGKG